MKNRAHEESGVARQRGYPWDGSGVADHPLWKRRIEIDGLTKLEACCACLHFRVGFAR